jgi:hypothetical protein
VSKRFLRGAVGIALATPAGAEAYFSAEPPLKKVKEVAIVEGTEKLVIKEARREPQSTPWKMEAEATEVEKREAFMLRAGMPQVASVSGSAGGGRNHECYPGEEVTEITHTKGGPTTEKVQIPHPPAACA